MSELSLVSVRAVLCSYQARGITSNIYTPSSPPGPAGDEGLIVEHCSRLCSYRSQKLPHKLHVLSCTDRYVCVYTRVIPYVYYKQKVRRAATYLYRFFFSRGLCSRCLATEVRRQCLVCVLRDFSLRVHLEDSTQNTLKIARIRILLTSQPPIGAP